MEFDNKVVARISMQTVLLIIKRRRLLEDERFGPLLNSSNRPRWLHATASDIIIDFTSDVAAYTNENNELQLRLYTKTVPRGDGEP